MKRSSFLLKALARPLFNFVLVLLAYLLQVSLMPELRIGDVTPNLMFAMVAIYTVSYGKLNAFWIGAFYGIVLETMQPTREMFSLLIYPVAALLGSVIFSDKSSRQLEYERSLGRSGRNVTPFLRMPLCAALNTIVYEVVNVTYIYLREGTIAGNAVGRAVLNVALTTLLTIVIMYPVRRLFGFKPVKPEPDAPKLY